ncbi:MAG: ABC transporter substrate-binding protein [Chloroflexi bacterium]|nr:ABC transporter substrate-binding protein [Chloroflexota bacterium]
MKRALGYVLFCALVLLSGAGALAQNAIELRFLCFNDGNECAVYADLLSRFSLDNPDIIVVVEVVDAADIEAQLSAQADAGAAPDIARVADFGALAGDYLDLRSLLSDADSFAASFQAPFLQAMRAGAGDALHGFPDAAAMVAPFVNVSLFERANVSLPGAGASWDEWLAALDDVAAATEASYALAVDNKDHRLVGPAMSLGAQYFDADRNLTLADDDGLRAFLEILHALMIEGKTPADTLLGTGASQETFTRGDAVMYICGSWKVEEVAAQVGDDFDWAIVANPSGSGGRTGVAQATALVALAGTDHPAAVAQVFEHLAQPDVYAEFSARALTIPAHLGVAASAIDYGTESETIAAALNAFARETLNLQEQAITLDLHPLADVYYEASNATLRAFFSGELSLDEALTSLKARLREAAS